MSFFSKTDDFVEMRVVDVGVDSEQSLKYLLNNISEILGEGNI